MMGHFAHSADPFEFSLESSLERRSLVAVRMALEVRGKLTWTFLF